MAKAIQSVSALRHPNPYINDILGLEPIKTWSLIVTIFGDYDGDVLTGSQLRMLLDPLGFKPETIRVALHRLKADGWILTQKSGREAHYRLSARGREETEEVRSEIYGPAEDLEAWSLVLLQDRLIEKEAIPIGRDAFLVPTRTAQRVQYALSLPLGNAPIPTWVEETLVPPQLLSTANELTSILASAKDDLDAMAPGDLAALRLLTLHHWRRLALRPGTRAHAALLKLGGIQQCRVAVVALLENSWRTSFQR